MKGTFYDHHSRILCRLRCFYLVQCVICANADEERELIHKWLNCRVVNTNYDHHEEEEREPKQNIVIVSKGIHPSTESLGESTFDGPKF